METLCHKIANPSNTCFINSTLQAWLVFKRPDLLRKESELQEECKALRTELQDVGINPKIKEKKEKELKNKEQSIQVIGSMVKWTNGYERDGATDIRPFLEDVLSKCELNGRLGVLGAEVKKWALEKKTKDPLITQEDAEELISWLLDFMASKSKVYIHQTDDLALQEGEQLVPEVRNDDPYLGRIYLSAAARKKVFQFEGHKIPDGYEIQEGQTLASLIREKFEEIIYCARLGS